MTRARVVPASRGSSWGYDVGDDTAGWRLRGACRRVDPDLMYPFPHDVPGQLRAIAVCHTCPVIDLCGRYALEHAEPDGVWGGMTEHERANRIRGRMRRCPACGRGHYPKYPNQLYCLSCRKPDTSRAERMPQ